jgi:hypothetical protein
MTVIIRDAELADMAALGILQLACWRETYGDLLSAEFFTGQSDQGRGDRWTQIFGRMGHDVYRKHSFEFNSTRDRVEYMENMAELRMTR